MGRPRKNQVTLAGNRRSESRTPPKFGHPVYAGIPRADLPRFIEEDKTGKWPGMHTVIVSKTNAHDPRAASNVNEYLGMGYKILSDNPNDSGHGDAVLMGIPVDDYLKKEDERIKEHNSALRSLIDGTAEALENMPKGVRFDEEGSGLSYGEDIPVIGQSGPDAED